MCRYQSWQAKIRHEDLWERAGQEPVAKQILRRKWGWIGHTLRKPASSTTRQALTWNRQGKRKRGRPRNSWRRDTEAELKQQGTSWSGMARVAQNRVRWRGVVDGLCSTGSDGHKYVSKSVPVVLCRVYHRSTTRRICLACRCQWQYGWYTTKLPTKNQSSVSVPVLLYTVHHEPTT